MYLILVFIHIIVCVFLISVILLQAGRGGGLNEAFGGTAESLLGTQAPTVLKKATEIGAILFIVMALLLGVVTARTSRSLFQQMKVPAAPLKAMPAVPAQTAAKATGGTTGTTATTNPAQAASTASQQTPAQPAQAAAPAPVETKK